MRIELVIKVSELPFAFCAKASRNQSFTERVTSCLRLTNRMTSIIRPFCLRGVLRRLHWLSTLPRGDFMCSFRLNQLLKVACTALATCCTAAALRLLVRCASLQILQQWERLPWLRTKPTPMGTRRSARLKVKMRSTIALKLACQPIHFYMCMSCTNRTAILQHAVRHGSRTADFVRPESVLVY